MQALWGRRKLRALRWWVCQRAAPAAPLLVSGMPGVEALLENRCVMGDPPMPRLQAPEGAVTEGAMNVGWVHSRTYFQFTQKWCSEPCAQRKSPSGAARASFLLVPALYCVPTLLGPSASVNCPLLPGSGWCCRC